MHFSSSRRRQLFRGNSFSALGRDSCISQWQYQNGFLVQALSSLPIKSAELPTRTAGWSPPHTNKQDPRPFKITHAHSGMGEFDKPGRDKAKPIPQISLKIVLMVPIWTLSNPLQYLTSPKKSRKGGGWVCWGWGWGGGVGVGVGGGGWFLDSTTYTSNGLENWLSLICTNIKLSL